jgi:hypothetical protein
MDDRSLSWGSDTKFSSRAAYKLLSPDGSLDASAITAWGTSLLSKIKIFC